MKNLLLSTTFVSIGLLAMPLSAQAQNYVPPVNYGGPNVIVNMDVLNPAPVAPTPLTKRRGPRLRSPAETAANVPIRLRRPTPRQVVAAPLEPVAPLTDPTVTTAAPMPKFAERLEDKKPAPEPKEERVFSAKDLVKAAETTPAPVEIEAPREIVNTAPEAAPEVVAVANRQRELLAKAREDVLYDTPPSEIEETKTVVEKTVAEIEDIAPSAAPIQQKQIPAPMPPATKLEPVLPTTLTTPPAMEKPIELVEEPVEMAALTAPETPVITPPPVVEESLQEAMTEQQEKQTEQRDGFRFVFEQGAADLSAQDAAQLDEIATRLTDGSDVKIQLRAFADGTPETSSKARRLSLTRALTVRSYLIDKGVAATAMDVRALGIGAPSDAPADRVDIVFTR